MDFFDRVKSICKEKKITIESVVNEAGFSIDTYNSMKRANNLPRANEAVAVAKILGTSVEYLVTGQGPTCPTERDVEIIQKALLSVQDILNKAGLKTDLN